MKYSRKLIKAFLMGITYMFLSPIVFLIPKKKNLIVIRGGKSNQLVDNTKYFYLYCEQQKNIESVFITRDKNIYKTLLEDNIKVVLFQSWKGIYTLLRASVLVIDSTHYTGAMRYLVLKAKIVQLWHGVGFKKIALDNPNNKNNKFRLLVDTILGRYTKYDLLVSTSDFFNETLFKTSINKKKILNLGYPRNDIFFNNLSKGHLINTDKTLLLKIEEFKTLGCKILLYTPTFREIKGNFREGDTLTEDNVFDLEKLNNFCKKNNLVFIFKLHPYTKSNYDLSILENLYLYNSTKDTYPLLRLTDLLITDYSSIYIDFLLKDKPIIFFPYDFKDYFDNGRAMQDFDYEWTTPGPKCFNQEELQKTIITEINNCSLEYLQKRQEMKNLSFQFQDGNSSKRILDEIIDNLL